MFTIEEDFHGWLLDQAAALWARDYEASIGSTWQRKSKVWLRAIVAR
jgi:hypothetical protein